MNILQIGDIVRISDSATEDLLEDVSFTIYKRRANTEKRIANIGQFGCVAKLTRIGLTDNVYAYVVPCQKNFDFWQDRHALIHTEGFFVAQSQVELVQASPLRTRAIPADVDGPLAGFGVPMIASPAPTNVTLHGGHHAPKGSHVSQLYDSGDAIDIEVDSEDGYVGFLRIPYSFLKQSFTTF